MKLFYSGPSPFARKCRIIARLNSIELEEISAMGMENPPELLKANPVAQIPALVLDDGTSVINSPVICAYLDPNKIFLPDGENGLKARRLEAFGDAMAEMAVKIALESRRDKNQQSPLWLERWHNNLTRVLKFIDNEIEREAAELNLGVIAIICAFEYARFRLKDFDFIPYKNIANLAAKYSENPAFKQTAP